MSCRVFAHSLTEVLGDRLTPRRSMPPHRPAAADCLHCRPPAALTGAGNCSSYSTVEGCDAVGVSDHAPVAAWYTVDVDPPAVVSRSRRSRSSRSSRSSTRPLGCTAYRAMHAHVSKMPEGDAAMAVLPQCLGRRPTYRFGLEPDTQLAASHAHNGWPTVAAGRRGDKNCPAGSYAGAVPTPVRGRARPAQEPRSAASRGIAHTVHGIAAPGHGHADQRNLAGLASQVGGSGGSPGRRRRCWPEWLSRMPSGLCWLQRKGRWCSGWIRLMGSGGGDTHCCRQVDWPAHWPANS